MLAYRRNNTDEIAKDFHCMGNQHHDIVVVGGGSAGYAAARTAREAGADVAIVDQGPLGGLCILRGCMPSKAILRSSEVMSLMGRAAEFGLLPVESPRRSRRHYRAQRASHPGVCRLPHRTASRPRIHLVRRSRRLSFSQRTEGGGPGANGQQFHHLHRFGASTRPHSRPRRSRLPHQRRDPGSLRAA